MVGVMVLRWKENAASLLNSAKVATGIPPKLEHLSRLNEELPHADYALLSDFLPQLLELSSDRFSPVRKFITAMIGEIGLKKIQFLPEIVPALIAALQDGTPAVARQAIACGINLFRCTLRKVAIQGLFSSELEESIASSWSWMLNFKESVCSIAFQPGNDGLRLPALRFIETIILLYTVDPNGSSDPPQLQAFEENVYEFNVSWLRGGHPLLNVGDLSSEASQNLSILLGQLRSTTVKSLSGPMIIVLINSLSAIANERPAFYGRILPVLLGMDVSSLVIEGVHIFAVRNTLKNAFLACLKCTHPGAVPWRDRLVGVLREMESGNSLEASVSAVSRVKTELEEGNDDLQPMEGNALSIELSDPADASKSRKRSSHDISEPSDENGPGKRVKPTPFDSEGSSNDLNVDPVAVQVDTLGQTDSHGKRDSGPVQQLVAMFGALVAQGERATSSLEILVSSISSDLLAEVVMTNMQHFPCNRPEDEASLLDLDSHANLIGSDAQGKLPSSFASDILSLSRILPVMVSISDVQPCASSDVLKPLGIEEDPMSSIASQDVPSSILATSTTVLPAKMEKDQSPFPSEIHEVGNEIPGLDSAAKNDGLSSTLVASSLEPADSEDGNLEQASSMDRRSPAEQIPSVSTDRSEELSSKTSVSSTPTSVGLSNQIVLPNMSAPVIELSDEQNDSLQTLAFMRIIDAYKHVSVAGGSDMRCSLLASIGVQFPLELEPWKLLQTHILLDYVNNAGHELTLCVLYRLFGVAEEQDFFSSTAATSIYEMFILTVAEALRDSCPPTDKSLIRLLGEAPYLPKSVIKLLECMCCPLDGEKDEKGLHGDRATQGLSAVWSLILLRPSIREECLKIALQSAVHHLEEVRMKAIRLVANKLFPLASIAQQIEDFAKEMLFSIANNGSNIDRVDAEGDSNLDKPVGEPSSISSINNDGFPENQAGTLESISSSSISEAQRYMSLYFALCTKRHSLFREIFVIYESASQTVKQAVHRHIRKLVCTMGSSPELLQIISDPPTGSEDILVQVLHTLTDGIVPPPAVTAALKKLYDSKSKDVETLIPILPFLPKEEVMLIFPRIVNLSPEKFKAALACAMQGSSPSGSVITPADVLFSIHGIDPDRDGIPLKKVTDACNTCLEQREIFTQQVFAMVLNQLVEQIPLPLLFMRTVIQVIGAFPALVDFIMDILSRLVSKQIWKYPKLWVGFLKCTFLTRPQSFGVLLQLPPAQLENALNKNAALKAPLAAHASQPEVQSSLPRSVLVVLGIASDPQTLSQARTTQAQAPAGSGERGLIKEKAAASTDAC